MTNPASFEKSIAPKLLELHVQHELDAFDETKLINWVIEETEALADWTNSTRLNQLVTAKTVKAFIHANVVKREIPEAFIEIADEATAWLLSSDSHLETHFSEVIDEVNYAKFVDQVLELDEQIKGGMNLLMDLPLYRNLLSGVIYQAITRYIYDANIISKSVPGVSSLLKMGQRVVAKTVPSLSSAVEENVRSYISTNLDLILAESEVYLERALTDEALKNAAMGTFEHLKDKTLGELQEGIDNEILTSFINLVFEYWEHFRTTAYFKTSYELIVDYFYEKYGEQNLDDLLEELQISNTLIIQEAKRFAPQVVAVLKQNGQLEAIIRRRLTSFYTSSAAVNCIANEEA